MTTLLLDMPSRLPDRSLFHLVEDVDQTIEVRQGTVWITQRNSPRDIVVAAGETVFLDHPKSAIVSAIGGPALVEAHTAGAKHEQHPFVALYALAA